MTEDVDRRDGEKPVTLRLKMIAAGLTVNDLQASLHFYSEVLGFHIAERFEHEGELRGAALVAGSAMMMISQDDWEKGRDRQKGVAVRLNMQASTDIDALAALIKERGGTLETEPADMPWGARAFNVVDPDGFMITIMS
jgi:uncharacterized glyoxalase superfamily protein PhnB